MRAISSATARRSLGRRRSHMVGIGAAGMASPLAGGDGDSLEGRQQLFNGGQRQDRRLGAGSGGLVGAGDGDVAELAGQDLDLAVPDVAGQVGDAGQAQGPAEKRMSGIGYCDLTLALLGDEGGITL